MLLPDVLPFQKRTIVRSTDAQTPVHTLMRVLARVSPGLAARVGERLFFTPRRYTRPAAETALLACAERSTLRLHGKRLAVARWGTGPAVLLVHGWAGRGTQLGSFVAPLTAAGLSVITFDAPAHGDSEGRRTSVLEMADAVELVVGSTGRVEAVVGHSLGAAACTLAMTRGLAVHAAVLVGAPARPSTFFTGFLSRLGVPAEAAMESRRRIETELRFRWEDLDVVSQAPGLHGGLLVIHDRDDAEVPWEDGAAIAAAWPGGELMLTDALGHRRVLKDPAVVRRAASFLADRLPKASRQEPWSPLELDLFDRDSRRLRIFEPARLVAGLRAR